MVTRAIGPWIPPEQPSLARLALEAADAEGLARLGGWPEVRGNGIAWPGLPTFLCWRGEDGCNHHLLLLQARELGALGQGARPAGLPARWLEDLDLETLARPLRRHPDFPGGAAVQVVRVSARGRAELRSAGPPAPALAAAVLQRLTAEAEWRVTVLEARL